MAQSIHFLVGNFPVLLQLLIAGLILAVGLWAYTTLNKNRPVKGFPVVSLSERGMSPQESWARAAPAVVAKGLSEHSGPFQVLTGTGPKIIIPNKFVDEFKSDPRLDFSGAISADFFRHYPGFEPLSSTTDPYLVARVVRVKLTQSLGLVTEHLVDEATNAIKELYGENRDWQTVPIKSLNTNLVTRLSSRVFLGKPLCHNPRWLEIARDYTINAMMATRAMRQQNPLLRPFAHLYKKENKTIVQQVKDANTLISGEVKSRIERTEKALAAGQKAPKMADAIGWMVEMGKGRDTDYVNTQLTLTMAAIHTTSEAMSLAILDICRNPEVVEPLREEIISVLSKEPWSKTALYKLKLMDSFLKESQRMHPPNVAAMLRLTTEAFPLSDGTVLPKGVRTMVATKYWDPTTYPNPQKFDLYRFKNLRNSSTASADHYQHVTTSNDFTAFGHGEHACPGRFFASNELKVALCHLLMKYDFAPIKEKPLFDFHVDGQTLLDPKAQVYMRRRQEEIKVDLDHVPE